MKYNREEFVSLMAKMEDKYSQALKIADSFDQIFGPCGVGCDFLERVGFNWYMDYLTETLEKMFAEELRGDDADILSCFVYESEFGKYPVYAHGVNINSAGELYDYMMREE